MKVDYVLNNTPPWVPVPGHTPESCCDFLVLQSSVWGDWPRYLRIKGFNPPRHLLSGMWSLQMTSPGSCGQVLPSVSACFKYLIPQHVDAKF